jgi:hypothetical protein
VILPQQTLVLRARASRIHRQRDRINASGDLEVLTMELFLGIPLWLLFGILGAWIATTKGRSGCGWFLLCALLGPIGLFIAAVISKKS